MSRIPCLAVVLEGGLVQSVLSQEWPTYLPPPRVVVVDYDIDGANEDDLTHFSIGRNPMVALCHTRTPERCEDCKAALSPRNLWEELAPEGSGDEADLFRKRLTAIEQSLGEYLAGYLGDDPVRREEVQDYFDWPRMARRELDRRGVRFLEALPDEFIQAIARGEVDLAKLARKIPA
jgi:hypothetical protein